MANFVNSLKGQVNALNILLFLFLFSVILFKTRRRSAALIIFGVTSLLFLLMSTAYLPFHLIKRIERTYTPFSHAGFAVDGQQVFIHVLGGGYTYDRKLPAQSQLTSYSLGRLTEGLRLSRLFANSRLVFSGPRVSGDESMAAIMKNAAVSLGADSSRIALLERARTTKEEALHFVHRYGANVTLIVVTDAIHMPRAIHFFKEVGVDAYAAPTNFLVKDDPNPFAFHWIPSAQNLLLMDRVLREALGSLKGSILN